MSDYAATILNLVEYEVWCNRQAVAFLSRLTEAELRGDLGFGLRTPHRTISHIVEVMNGWSGSVGPVIEPPVWTPYEETETLESIGRTIARVGQCWLAATTESHRAGLLGIDRRLEQVFHLITHGSHHRGQLLSMITILGHEQPFEGGDYGGWSNPEGRPVP